MNSAVKIILPKKTPEGVRVRREKGERFTNSASFPGLELWARMQGLRRLASLSIQELAEKSSVSRQAIHNIETGKRKNPGIETIRKICKALKVSLGEFD